MCTRLVLAMAGPTMSPLTRLGGCWIHVLVGFVPAGEDGSLGRGGCDGVCSLSIPCIEYAVHCGREEEEEVVMMGNGRLSNVAVVAVVLSSSAVVVPTFSNQSITRAAPRHASSDVGGVNGQGCSYENTRNEAHAIDCKCCENVGRPASRVEVDNVRTLCLSGWCSSGFGLKPGRHYDPVSTSEALLTRSPESPFAIIFASRKELTFFHGA